ncbi:MAG: glycosyltransferase family 2 protein [bacterium]
MKISGFTIIRNAIINDYPAVEAITSILPVVDEMIVAVGKSDDDTEGLIRSIGSDKIKIVNSEWDLSQLPGGRVMAIETDKAFKQISTDSDWAFYIQCDEVVHEQYHASIIESCKKYLNDRRVCGLVFNYVHFYGTYDYYGDSRRWYDKEIRIIRNDQRIYSFKDAQGFRMDGKRLPSKLIDASIYHYGWVKRPELMDHKLRTLSTNWMGQAMKDKLEKTKGVFNYDEYDSLERFKGTHPAVMQRRISEKNWHVDLDVTKKRFTFKKWIMYVLEKATGIRLFSFRNYKLV